MMCYSFWLIDVLYDNHVNLVASFEVDPDRLYADAGHSNEAQRITSRLLSASRPSRLGGKVI